MVDKQVIMDGCDVAGCEYLGLYKECKLKCGSCCPVNCKDNPNCYYKQLKRKEQECEVIVADAEVTYTHLEHRIEMCDLLGKSLKVKEQECERLEEANNTLTVTREKLLGDLYIVEENLKDYIEHYNRQSEEVDQLKTENERLKNELSTYGATGICETCTEKSVLKCDQLEVENDELKKWKENVINLFDKTCRCKYLNEESAYCSFYNKECIAINQCLYKNQQTLTEIKFWARELLKRTGQVVPYEIKQILQKLER